MSDKDQKSEEQQFIELLYAGVRAWEQAGKLLVKMLARNPNIKRRILEKNPEVSPGTLAMLEKVGRGMVAPELLLSDAPGFKMARELPISDQRQIASKSVVPLLIKNGDAVDVIEAKLGTLTAEQSRQVFAKDHIRDAAEQRLYIEDRSKPNLTTTPWIIDGDTVRFRKGVTLSSTQLSAILSQMVQRAALPN